jgi:hypothetical protein
LVGNLTGGAYFGGIVTFIGGYMHVVQAGPFAASSVSGPTPGPILLGSAYGNDYARSQWIRVSDLNARGVILMTSISGFTPGWGVGDFGIQTDSVNFPGVVRITPATSNASSPSLPIPGAFATAPIGSWILTSLSYDFATDTLSLYVNGALVSTVVLGGTFGALNPISFCLAATGFGYYTVPNGTAADFQDARAMNRQLSAGDMAALFAAGPNGADAVPPPGPAPYVPPTPIPPPPGPTPPYPPPTPPTPRYIPPAPNPGNTCVQVLFTCQYVLGVATWVQTSAACVPNAQCAPQSLVVDSNLLYFEQQGGCPLNVLPSPLPAVPPIASPYPYLLNPLQPLVTIPAPCAPAPFDGCLKTTHSCQCMSGGPNSTPVWVLDSAVCVPGTQCLGVTGPNPNAQGAYRQEHPSACYLGETVPPGSIVVPPIAPDCCRCCKDWSATCAGGVWTVTRSAEACVQPASCAPTAWQSVQPDSCAMTRRTQGTTACATQAACANNVDQPPNPTSALTVPPCCNP